MQLEATASHPITSYLGEETNSCFTTTSFKVVVQSNKVPPQPPFLQAKQPQFPQLLLVRHVEKFSYSFSSKRHHMPLWPCSGRKCLICMSSTSTCSCRKSSVPAIVGRHSRYSELLNVCFYYSIWAELWEVESTRYLFISHKVTNN